MKDGLWVPTMYHSTSVKYKWWGWWLPSFMLFWPDKDAYLSLHKIFFTTKNMVTPLLYAGWECKKWIKCSHWTQQVYGQVGKADKEHYGRGE